MPPALRLSNAGLVPQGYAFGFFNLMHVGLAFAVTRWRVFDLDRYAYYVWLWLVGAALILAVDLALVGWLNRQPWASLAMSLLVAGFLYFPLRQMLLRWLFTPRRATIEGHTAELLGVALTPTDVQQDRRWDALLMAIYAPAAAIERPAVAPAVPGIVENGLALDIPGAAGLAPRRLRYAAGGGGSACSTGAMWRRRERWSIFTAWSAKAATLTNPACAANAKGSAAMCMTISAPSC